MTNVASISEIFQRRADRLQVEMLAHFRHGVATITVMLKDLSRYGARIDGVASLNVDEVVSITLPSCRPQMAFVAWSKEHCAGLEFAQPLQADDFDALTEIFAMGARAEKQRPSPVAVPMAA